MITPRLRHTPRKKFACEECKLAKKRCSHQKPTCARCREQGKECRYRDDLTLTADDESSTTDNRLFTPAASSILTSPAPCPSTASTLPVNEGLFNLALTSVYQTAPSQHASPESAIAQAHADFQNVSLVPMLDADDIRDRWLKPYLMTGPGHGPKYFPIFTGHYLSCTLRSYPSQLLDEHMIPPFIHPMQLARKPLPPALANCSSLVRFWMNRAPGSEGLVLNTLKKEIDRLVAEKQSIGDFDLLCSFQALLVYMLMAYFFPLGDTQVLGESDIAILHELAFFSAKRGLICLAETNQNRPDWESWIVASAKRRTLLTMYLFTNVYNASKNMPNFISHELADVLVPDNKALWLSSDRTSWGTEYNRHLAKWEDGMLTIGELWRSPVTGIGAEKRWERIERWVQSADEFGMMLFAVAAHLHGC